MSEDLYGRDVICLASLGWDAHFCTPQQIAVRLGRRCKVLYVEPLRSPLHALKRSGTQSRRPARAPYEVAPGVWLLTLPPLFVPMVLYRRVPLLRRLNNWLMSRWVRHAARQAGLHDPVVWAYQITYEGAPLLREAPLAVYDCIDRLPASRDADAAPAGGHRALFTRFLVLVEANYLAHWPVSRYASRLGLSTDRLNRLVRGEAGASALEIFHRRLAREACRRLVYVAAPVSRLAQELGFDDPAYFCRFVKRHTGLSPRAYRDQRAAVSTTA